MNEDENLARRLQSESGSCLMGIADEYDPNPDLHELFLQFDQMYFYSSLASVEVRWSKRMTLCAGICYYYMGGYCSVRLSEPLLKFRPRSDMINTLLHEMIHAYLFVTASNRDRDGHGPEFQKHMDRINKQAGTSITIYHSFHDEVNHYKVHVWKCNGPCQHKPPYFGTVKRSMNRPPQPHDFWWKEHQSSCGGTFTKIQGPEQQESKKEKRKNTSDGNEIKKNKKIDEMIPRRDSSNKSTTSLGSKPTGLPPSHLTKTTDQNFDDISCPVCQQSGFTNENINQHLDLCLK